MPDDLVGVNLDTMNDMREQFEEKEKKYLRVFKDLESKSSCLSHQVDDVIETLEIQQLILKKVFDALSEVSEYEEEITGLVNLIESSHRIGLLNYSSEQKWNLYKTAVTLNKTITEQRTIIEVSLS